MATANDTRLSELRAAVVAIRDLPELLKPYTVNGTKLRLPKEIGDPLHELEPELRRLLDNVHFEGVNYAYQDEPNASNDLKARCEALGYELIVSDKGEQFVIDDNSSDGPRVLLFSHTSDDDDSLEEWPAKCEQVSESETTGETDDRPEITVLVGDHCNAIYGLHGIVEAICKLDQSESIELAIAARELTKRLYGGLGNLLGDVERKIEQAAGMKVRQ